MARSHPVSALAGTLLPRIWRPALSALSPVLMALLHGALLYGILAWDSDSAAMAEYLRYWPAGEAAALILTPYLMLIAVRDHKDSLLQRVAWLPLIILFVYGVSAFVRLLRAFWLYALARLVVLWPERPTADRAAAGCLRSTLSLGLLVVLAAVFLNRPYRWPVGDLVGEGLPPERVFLGNTMAFGACYFTVVAVAELVVRLRRRASGRPA